MAPFDQWRASEQFFWRTTILDLRAYNLLALYEQDFKGLIPHDAYFILGNIPTGTQDSTRFGLIHKNDLLGRVVIKP